MEDSINKKDPLGIYPFIRTVNDFPIKGIKFRDITSLIENPKAFVKTCEELTRITREYSANFIVSIESRGFIFSGAIACNLYLPFVLARKPGKLPNDTFKKNYDVPNNQIHILSVIDLTYLNGAKRIKELGLGIRSIISY